MKVNGVNIQIVAGNIARFDYNDKGRTPRVRLNVACNSKVKKGDEWVDKTDYVNCTFFGKQAENLNRLTGKGLGIIVEGHSETHEYEGKWYTTCIGHKFSCLEYKNDSSQGGGGGNEDFPDTDSGASNDMDDDIPF